MPSRNRNAAPVPVPLPRPNPERQFEREYMDNVIGGMMGADGGMMGSIDGNHGNGAYTPPGLQPQLPPIGREELDALIQKLLQPPTYDERGFVPGRTQAQGGMLPDPGSVEFNVKGMPPLNDEDASFEQYYGEKDT